MKTLAEQLLDIAAFVERRDLKNILITQNDDGLDLRIYDEGVYQDSFPELTWCKRPDTASACGRWEDVATVDGFNLVFFSHYEADAPQAEPSEKVA